MKKLVSLILTLAMLLGMTVAASAAGEVIEGVSGGFGSSLGAITLDSSLSASIPLDASMFEWKDGTEPTRLTSSHLNKVKVSTARNSGSVIETVRISGTSLSVTFKESARSITQDRDFSIEVTLYVGTSKGNGVMEEIDGTVLAKVNDDIADGDYVDLSDGGVVIPEKAARNVELYLGADVTVKLNLSAKRKYSGTAYYEISSSDRNLLNKYSSIDDIIIVKQSGLSAAGKCVTIDVGENYYVYNAERQYIGRSSALLPLSTKYYLSYENIDMGAEPASSTTAPAPSTTTSSSSSGTISKSQAVSAAKSALAKSKNASVRYKDATAIASSTLKAMNDEAVKVSGKVSLNADTMNGSKIMGRLTIPAASHDDLSSTVKLGVYTDSKNTSDVKAQFEKGFNNKIAVISMAQKGSFGATVTVIARPDLSSFNTKTLYLYSYDKSSNKYRQLTNTSATVDKNGYLNFKTSYGGEIIVTDSLLKRK